MTKRLDQSEIRLPCKHLRHKAMFYEERGAEEDSPSTVYWCAKTQEGFGPDGRPAERGDCCPGRSCYIR